MRFRQEDFRAALNHCIKGARASGCRCENATIAFLLITFKGYVSILLTYCQREPGPREAADAPFGLLLQSESMLKFRSSDYGPVVAEILALADDGQRLLPLVGGGARLAAPP